MITPEQKKEIKKVLGTRYTVDILSVLKKKELFNLKGKPFSQSFIRSVLNGHSNNVVIENIIFELYRKKKKQQTNLLNKRTKMLSQ